MFKNWSFSRLMDYERCAFYAKLKHIDRIPDPSPKKAADRGTAVHTAAELYINGTAPIIGELEAFETEFQQLRALQQLGMVAQEEEWGFDKDWKSCDYKDAWLRMKLDVAVYEDDDHAIVIDFKTGRKIGNEVKHSQQLALYALALFLRNDDLSTCTAELWYLDLNDITKVTYTRKQALQQWPRFEERADKMCSDKTFKPNPNVFSCRYCAYGPDGTGDCKTGVSKTINLIQMQRKR